MELSQGKLALGWRLGECMEEPDLAALRVLNSMLINISSFPFDKC